MANPRHPKCEYCARPLRLGDKGRSDEAFAELQIGKRKCYDVEYLCKPCTFKLYELK